MVVGIIAGFLAGVLIGWGLTNTRSCKKEAVFEDKVSTMRSEVTSLRYEKQEADARHTRFELEIRKHRDLAVLFPELVKQLLAARTPDELAKLLARAMNRLTGCSKIAIFLADIRGGKLGLVHSDGFGEILKQPLVVNVGDGHVGFSAETGMIFEKRNLESESQLTRTRLERTSIPGFIPDLAAPMVCQGILYGVICLDEIPITATLPKERLASIAAVGAAALEGIRLLGRFESAADMDPDTGLPGRGRLEPILQQELERVRRFDSPLTVVELVIERGAIEDKFRAREFMSIGANHLKATMRNIDTGLRTSPDKLILLLPGTGHDGMENVMQRLLKEMPRLENDAGDTLGTVRMRFHVVEGGVQLVPEAVLGELEKKAFISSMGGI